MPDPDIPPIVLTDEEIADIQAGMPMLPGEYRKSWTDLALDKSVVDTILGHQEIADLLQQTYRLADSDQGGVLSKLGVDKQGYAALMRRIFNWFASTPDEMIDLVLTWTLTTSLSQPTSSMQSIPASKIMIIDVSEGHDVGVGHDLDLGVGDAVLPLDEERVGDHADDQGEEVGADDDHDGDDGHGWFLSGSWSHYGACEF